MALRAVFREAGSLDPRYDGFVVVLRVHLDPGADLPGVRKAVDRARLLARLGKDREQDRCQDGYDGNHYQQLDQREALLAVEHHQTSLRVRVSARKPSALAGRQG